MSRSGTACSAASGDRSIPWMIELAALLSAVVQKRDDFVIITIMLLVNAGLDFFQEHRALNALKALNQCLTAEIIVLRDRAFSTLACCGRAMRHEADPGSRRTDEHLFGHAITRNILVAFRVLPCDSVAI